MTSLIENGNFITKPQIFRNLENEFNSLDGLIKHLDESSNYLISDRFIKIINFFKNNDYIFGQLNDRLPDYNGNKVYLRYDVHVQDVSSALILAKLHNNLKVHGLFYITWDFSNKEVMSRDLFLHLKSLKSEYVQFGLHTAPACQWFAEILGYPDFHHCRRELLNGTYDQQIISLSNQLKIDQNFFDNSIDRIIEIYKSQVDAFEKSFGFYKSISGHGNNLIGRVTKINQGEGTDLNHFLKIVNPNEFFSKYDCQYSAVEYESTVFDGNRKNYNILFDGQGVNVNSDKILDRFDKRLSIFTLWHPANISGKLFTGLIEMTETKLNNRFK